MAARAVKALVLVFVVLGLLGTSLTLTMVQPELEQVEESLARKDLLSLEGVVTGELQGLALVLADLVRRADDLASLDASFFKSRNLDFMLVKDGDGQLRQGAWYADLADSWKNDFTDRDSGLNKLLDLVYREPGTVQERLVSTSFGTVLAVAMPISPVVSGEKPTGFLVTGRFLKSSWLQEQAVERGIVASIHEVRRDYGLARIKTVLESLDKASQDVLFLDQGQVRVLWKQLRDNTGMPVFLLALPAGAALGPSGAGWSFIPLWAFLAGALAMVVPLVFWLRRNVQLPLARMVRAGRLMHITGHYRHKLPQVHSREFNQLSLTFNQVIGTLANTKDRLERALDSRNLELSTVHTSLGYLQEAFAKSKDPILVLDSRGVVRMANKAFQELGSFGIVPNNVPLSRLFRTPLTSLGASVEGGQKTLELELKLRHGGFRTIKGTLSRLESVGDENPGTVITFARDLADSLTLLPSASILEDRTVKALAQNRRSGKLLAFLCLDIAGFAQINEKHGCSKGDLVLQEMARRIKTLVRPGDTVSRIYGDRFVVMFEDQVDEKGVVHLASRALGVLGAPVQVPGGDIVPHLSLGISLGPQDGNSYQELCDHAVEAMLRGRKVALDSFALYTPELDSRARERLSLEHDLPVAISRGELRVWYQPRQDLASGELRGYEALVRWYRQGTLYLPAQFLSQAGDMGLLGNLDQAVLEQACKDHGRIVSEGMEGLKLSLNCSPRGIQGQYHVENLVRILDSNAMDPRNLEFECAEPSLMDDLSSNLRTINRLRSLGISLGIDNFGTGSTSLLHLNRVPASTLKLDRSLVQGLLDFQTARTIEKIVAMAKSLGFVVVADGVESSWQRDTLRDLGCDQIQGYLLAPPMPLEDFLPWLRGMSPARLDQGSSLVS